MRCGIAQRRRFRYICGMRVLPIVTVVVVCLGIIAFVFAVPTLERQARSEIVKVLREKLDAKVELKSVRIASLWPLGLTAQSLRIIPHAHAYRIEIERIAFRYFYAFNPRLEIRIEGPNLTWTGSPAGLAADPTLPRANAKPFVLAPMLGDPATEISIVDGLLVWRPSETVQFRIENFGLGARKAKLLDESEPIHVTFTSDFRYLTPFLNGKTHISSDANEVRIDRDQIITKKFDFYFGGILVHVNGVSKIKEALHDWFVEADVEDLAQLPKHSDLLPAENWRGRLRMDAAVRSHLNETTTQATVKLEHVGADAKLDSPDVGLTGPVQIDASVAFTWRPAYYEWKDLDLQLNMQDSEFRYGNLFKKPKGVPLQLTMTGSIGSEKIDLSRFALDVLNLRAEMSGTIGKTGEGKISLHIPETDLAGWEKNLTFLPLAGIKGLVELDAAITGSLAESSEFTWDVRKFGLRNLDWRVHDLALSDGVKLDGSFQAGLEGSLKLQGSRVLEGDVTGHVVADHLLIEDQNRFIKDMDLPLRLQFAAKSDKNDLILAHTSIRLPFGTTQVAGAIRDPFAPQVEFKTETSVTNLAAFQSCFPKIKDCFKDSAGAKLPMVISLFIKKPIQLALSDLPAACEVVKLPQKPLQNRPALPEDSKE